MHEEEIITTNNSLTSRNVNLSVAAGISPILPSHSTILATTSLTHTQNSPSTSSTPTISTLQPEQQTQIVLNNNNVVVAPTSTTNLIVSTIRGNSLEQNCEQTAQTTSTNNSVIGDGKIPESSNIDVFEVSTYEEGSEGYQESSGSSTNGGSISQPGYLSLLPPVGGLSVPCDQTDLKDLIEELCPVCGDKVSGYHYGLLTCESCKGFFKRTVQNKKVYTCVAERSCHIDKTQRKRCPYCRFQKCLDVGMKLEAVRADRMRGGRNKFGPMYKRDRARKLQILRQRQLALQAIRGSIGTSDGVPSQLSQLSPGGYQQPYTNMPIKQEIQIPQVSSLTSSPDSSPSPIALALNQVNPVASSVMTNCGPTHTSTTAASISALQNSVTDSKLWLANSTTASPHSVSPKSFSFETAINSSSNAESSSGVETLRVSPMIREFVQTVDDREWQQQLFSLLQSQSYNQCEVDLFELMCKVLDQNLFSQVDWARNTIFFKDLKVDDQMKLLQNSWSDMLVLDHLHHRIHNGLPDETTLPNGQKFDLLGLGLLGVPQLSERFNELQNKLLELKFDVGDYICMKFLLLLNPDVRGITNKKTVVEGFENVQAALLDYTLTCYPSVADKFSKLLSIIPDIHTIAARGEEHLYLKHVAGGAPTQTLLMEMLHAKRK